MFHWAGILFELKLHPLVFAKKFQLQVPVYCVMAFSLSYKNTSLDLFGEPKILRC